MNTRQFTALLMLGAFAAACSERMPTDSRTHETRATRDTQAMQASKGRLAEARKALLTNIPVTGAAFAGTMSITHIDYDQASNQLLFTGTITTAEGAIDSFTGVPGTLSRTSVALGSATSPILATNFSIVSLFSATQADCSILYLSLQPLHLDLLGLVVDLDAVVLNLHAQSGPGNLLGNLLCAVTGLLDGPGALSAITSTLDRINTLLAGI